MIKKWNVVLIVTIAIVAFAQMGCQQQEDPRIAKLQKELEGLKGTLAELQEEENDVEIAPYMHRLQRYLFNIYYAGEAENKELVKFYVHEIEEIMEELVDYGIYDDGIDISKNMDTYGVKGIEAFEKSFSDTEFKYFNDAYQSLVSSCNACHKVSNYGFIELQTPTGPAPSQQKFEVD